MNTTKKLPQAKHDQWAVLCKEQSESGLTVRQWCEQNGYTIHTYNYWKHRLKESLCGFCSPGHRSYYSAGSSTITRIVRFAQFGRFVY